MFVDRSEDSRIMISEIAKYAGCRTTKKLRLSDDIDILESKYYLRASRCRKSLSDYKWAIWWQDPYCFNDLINIFTR